MSPSPFATWGLMAPHWNQFEFLNSTPLPTRSVYTDKNRLLGFLKKKRNTSIVNLITKRPATAFNDIQHCYQPINWHHIINGCALSFWQPHTELERHINPSALLLASCLIDTFSRRSRQVDTCLYMSMSIHVYTSHIFAINSNISKC